MNPHEIYQFLKARGITLAGLTVASAVREIEDDDTARTYGTPTEVSRMFGITAAGTTGLCDSGDKQGLIQRRYPSASSDRRTRILETTPKGREMLDEFARANKATKQPAK